MLKESIEKFSDKVIIQTAKMDIYNLPRMTTVYDINIKFKINETNKYYKSLSTNNYYKTEDKEEQRKKEEASLLHQKQNLEELVGHHICTIQEIIDSYEKCIIKDIPVKIVLLGNELIAIANRDETKFLLTEDISKSVITKNGLIHYIEGLLSEKASSILKNLSYDISAFNEFLKNNKQHIPNLTIDDFSYLEKSVSQLAYFLKSI